MVKSYQPKSLKEALELRSQEKVTPYAGGTDLMIKAEEETNFLFLNKVPELKRLVEDEEHIRIGAGCTFTEILESKITPAVLKEAVAQIAAPAIRNLGTAGGNICNGSPKADSGLVFFATDAKLRIASSKGERIIPITEFYLGRNKTSLQEDELLVEILMKKNGVGNYYYKKVGARNALAISRVSFTGIMDVKDGKIHNCQTAFGAVSDVVIRKPEIDALLIGKTIEEAKKAKKDYLEAFNREIVPIRGRISAEFRKHVCMNLLSDFLESNGI